MTPVPFPQFSSAVEPPPSPTPRGRPAAVDWLAPPAVEIVPDVWDLDEAGLDDVDA